MFRASLIICLLLYAGSVSARPPYRQALKRVYGAGLPRAMQACSTCHLTRQQSDDPAGFDETAPPHNVFGLRLVELAEEQGTPGSAADIAIRLDQVGLEDADGDLVSNDVEIFSGHAPGNAADQPTVEEIGAVSGLAEQLTRTRKGYRWAPFVAINQPQLSVSADDQWILNPIDTFIAQKHVDRQLDPRPAATRPILLRRVSLDLLGLPPTPETLHRFLDDASPDAYEQVVDRFLASPQHGERWGRHWMDVWRYSDWAGHGKQIRDSQPHIWRWRDWIVESLNADKPYDRMLTEMLAADELWPTDPDALRATGFLARNYKKLSREVWMQDTVHHTLQAFTGLTVGCARCHDHMYDPISQEEYYRLRAIFEAHDVRDEAYAVGSDPLVRVFDAHVQRPTYLFEQGDELRPDKDQTLQPGVPALFREQLRVEPVVLPAVAYYPALRSEAQVAAREKGAAKVRKATERVVSAEERLAAARKRLARFVETPPEKPRRQEVIEGMALLDEPFAEIATDRWTVEGGDWEIVQGRLRQADGASQHRRVVSRLVHPRDFRVVVTIRVSGGAVYRSIGFGFDIHGQAMHTVYLSAYPGASKVQVALQNGDGVWSYPQQGMTALPVELGRDYRLELRVRERLLNVLVDGQLVVAYVLPPDRAPGQISLWTFSATGSFDNLRLTELAKQAIVRQPAANGGVAAVETEAGLRREVAEAEDASIIAKLSETTARAELASLVQRQHAERTKFGLEAGNQAERAQAASRAEVAAALASKIEQEFRARQQVVQLKRSQKKGDGKAAGKLAQAEKTLAASVKALAETRQRADTDSVEYQPLGAVHPTTSTGRRSALARWLTHPDHPLTARVAANQIWMRHIGQPLVPTVLDFGQNGTPPTHPALLDWLSAEWMRRADGLTSSPLGWSMKRLHRMIVTAQTYRMASTPDTRNLRMDPDNRWLWRVASRRMEAELVRDGILFVSGNLDLAQGGPDIDHGLGLSVRRRSLYFRHAQEKQMEFLKMFDCAAVSECYQRKESIVPQQALALVNSKITFRQARKIARRLHTRAGSDQVRFATAAFELVLSRPPTSDEISVSVGFLTQQRDLLAATGSKLAATGGALSDLSKPSGDPSLRSRENFVHVLLNHNDFVTIR